MNSPVEIKAETMLFVAADPFNSYSSRKIFHPHKYIHVFGKDFVPNLSIIDLLFSEGPSSLEVINNSDSF